MPHDYTYGMKTSMCAHPIDDIIKHNFADDRLPDKFAKLEKDYKPQYMNNRLKPPKPTIGSQLRLLKNKADRHGTPTNTSSAATESLAASNHFSRRANSIQGIQPVDQLQLVKARSSFQKNEAVNMVDQWWEEQDNPQSVNEEQAKQIT